MAILWIGVGFFWHAAKIRLDIIEARDRFFFQTHDLLEEGAPLRQRRTLRIGVDVFSACDKTVLRSRWQAVSAPTRRDRPPPQTLSHKQKTRQVFGSGFGRSHGYTIGQTRRHCTTRGDNGWANGL